MGGIVPRPMGNSHPNVVPYRNFIAADGELIIAVGNDGQFASLCRLLGLAELAGDPRFVTNSARVRNRDGLEAILAGALVNWPRAALLEAMDAAGVPGGPINTVDKVFADPQVEARGMLERHMGRTGTDLPFTRFPARLSATPATITTLPPGLGEHTDSVLAQRLGLSASQIAGLHAAGVVAGSTRAETEAEA